MLSIIDFYRLDSRAGGGRRHNLPIGAIAAIAYKW